MDKISVLYTQMIYIAVATLHLYSKNVKVLRSMTVGNFRERYARVCTRVCEEILANYSYELSYDQMDRAIYAYMSGVRNPQDVEVDEMFVYKGKGVLLNGK